MGLKSGLGHLSLPNHTSPLTGAARAVSQAGGQAAQPLEAHACPGRPPRRCAVGTGPFGSGQAYASTPRGLGSLLRRGLAHTCRGQAQGLPVSLALPCLPSRTPTPLSLPPHLTQANTSKSNVLFTNSAPSTRGLLSFIPSFLAAASLPALASSAPAWGALARHSCFRDTRLDGQGIDRSRGERR
jgi:hypothetical protein